MTEPAYAAPIRDGGTSLIVLSRRIANELTTAGLICQRAEDLVARLAVDGGAPLDQLSPLQSLDELTQRLGALAAVLNAVADRAHADWTLELGPLLDQVRLGDLALRLAGEPHAGAVSGEADIF